MKWLVVLLSILILGSSLFWWLKSQPAAPLPLESKSVNLGQVEVSVMPLIVTVNKPMVFKLTLTTHSVELSYDFTRVISASDERGNNYQAINWSGGSGGHHLEGNLTFDPLKSNTKQLKLIFIGIDQKGGELTWEL